MAQTISKNKVRSKVNRTDVLLNEMKRRKQACLNKLQKLSDRINILEQFKIETSGTNVSLKNYLKSKGYDYRDVFCPMGYFTPNMMVVSDDMENDYLTYHKGMSFNKNVGYPIVDRAVVSESDHQEITSSIYGMTWNPALMHYYPTTVFDTKAFTSAEEMGDSGMDIVGGLKTEDYANLTNATEYGQELVSMVQGLLEEEFDNVEDELEVIEEAEMKLNGFSNFESDEDAKVKSGRNALCRKGCKTKHPFNKSKRESCEAECDKKYKPSQKQEGRREDKDARKEARKEFREDKKSCKNRLKSGELQQWQYRECLKKERKEKRSDIKDAGGNVFGRTWRTTAKVNPILASSRGGVLILVGENTWGFATRLAPALLPDAEAKELFKPEAIVKAKKGWEKVSRGYRNLGGDPEKLKNKAIEGYKKKPYKVARKSSFEGDAFYEFEEMSNFAEPSTIILAVTSGLGALGSLVGAFTKAGGEKNPYKDDKTPQDYKNALADGTVETNPVTEENAPILNEKGEWVEPSTGKVIDPITGKYKDTIFGVNKWVAIGVGVVAVFGLYYVLKGKK
jgi:hypothetical protein